MDLLPRLLAALACQKTDPDFRFEVVVVDNDRERSSAEIVRRFAAETGIDTTYYCEAERNIAHSRNASIRHARGNLLAFIDDDERPAADWLVQLYQTMKAQTVDGVLGPVLPEFQPGAPRWLVEGRFLDRRRHATGTRISSRDARTGNVLMRRSLFPEGALWFDPGLGRTGGEDSDFFARQFNRGMRFVWCDEAAVHEAVPPARWKPSFYLERSQRSGALDGQAMRNGTFPGGNRVVRNALVFCGCAAVAVPALVLPKRLWMRVVQKLIYAGAVVGAFVGLPVLRDRE